MRGGGSRGGGSREDDKRTKNGFKFYRCSEWLTPSRGPRAAEAAERGWLKLLDSSCFWIYAENGGKIEKIPDEKRKRPFF